jgi:hypothetical protein
MLQILFLLAQLAAIAPTSVEGVMERNASGQPVKVRAYDTVVDFDANSGATCDDAVIIKTRLESAMIRSGAQRVWLDAMYPGRSDEKHAVSVKNDESRIYSEYNFADAAGAARHVCFDVSDSLATPKYKLLDGLQTLLGNNRCANRQGDELTACQARVAAAVSECAKLTPLLDNYEWRQHDQMNAGMKEITLCAIGKVDAKK